MDIAFERFVGRQIVFLAFCFVAKKPANIFIVSQRAGLLRQQSTNLNFCMQAVVSDAVERAASEQQPLE